MKLADQLHMAPGAIVVGAWSLGFIVVGAFGLVIFTGCSWLGRSIAGAFNLASIPGTIRNLPRR